MQELLAEVDPAAAAMARDEQEEREDATRCVICLERQGRTFSRRADTGACASKTPDCKNVPFAEPTWRLCIRFLCNIEIKQGINR